MVFKSYFYQVQLVGYMYVHLQYELVLVLVELTSGFGMIGIKSMNYRSSLNQGCISYITPALDCMYSVYMMTYHPSYLCHHTHLTTYVCTLTGGNWTNVFIEEVFCSFEHLIDFPSKMVLVLNFVGNVSIKVLNNYQQLKVNT